jgi:hypothetical protein
VTIIAGAWYEHLCDAVGQLFYWYRRLREGLPELREEISVLLGRRPALIPAGRGRDGEIEEAAPLLSPLLRRPVEVGGGQLWARGGLSSSFTHLSASMLIVLRFTFPKIRILASHWILV